MKSGKIASVIVTYNRLEFLKMLVEALRNQSYPVDEIIVVNNDSTDGTTDWLEKQSEITIINQPNLGSSGGQYTGIKYAYEQGYEWIWTMDDDIAPESDCLEKLIETDINSPISAPLRYKPNGEPYLNDTIEYNLTNPFKSFWKSIVSTEDVNNKFIDAVGITFEGPLIHRSVVEKIGLPEKDFFIYADDTEYFIRAFKACFRISIITDARMNRKLDLPYSINQFSWKTYYVIRNIIALNRIHGSFSVKLIRPIAYLFLWLTRSRNLSDIKTCFKAFRDGVVYKQQKMFD